MKHYVLTRLLPIYYVIASCGVAYSGQMINGGFFFLFPFIVSWIGILLFFVLLRIDNDLQDIARDKIAYPNRVILKKVQLQSLEKMIWRASIFFFVFLTLFYLVGGIFYGLALVYFWVQRKRLREPILDHLYRQGMIIPIALFASAMGFGVSVSYALVLFGAFSTYEICRKLDPFAHPAILSLLQFYGFRKVYWIVVGQLCVSALGAYFLDSYLILWPAEIGVLYILSTLYKSPRKFHMAHVAGALSLFVHIWFA